MATVLQAEKFICERVLEKISFLGYKKLRGSLLVKQKPNGIAWQLRFAARKDEVTRRILVGVFAGIRFDAIEVFRERDSEDCLLPSISLPVYFLHQNRQLVEWDVEVPDSVEYIVNEIEMYVLPFFCRYENLLAVLNALSSPDPGEWLGVARNERPELLAAILMSLGRTNEGRGVLLGAIDERQSKPLKHRIRFERMLKHIDNQ